MGILNFLLGSKSAQQTTGEAATEQAQKTLTQQLQETDTTTVADISAVGTSAQEQVTSGITTQDQATTTTGATTGQQATESSLFSEEILTSLESLTSAAAGRVDDGLEALQEKATSTALGFDIKAFTDSIVAGAGQSLTDERQANINALSSSVGGSAATSSVASNFQASQERKDLTALAAIAANAEAVGSGIQQNQLTTAATLEGLDLNKFLALAGTLKGGVTTGTAVTEGTQTQAGTTTGTGTTAETAATTGTTTQDQTTEETVNSLVQALLQSEAQSTSETEQAGTVTGQKQGSILDAITGIITAVNSG